MDRVERDRLRERERQARAQMSNEREDPPGGAPLFGAPVRVNPSPEDRVKQNIQSKLGEYDKVKHLLDEHKQLLGYDGLPPASPAPAPASHSPSKRHEFKKPPSSSHPSRSAHHTSRFVKPGDSKQSNYCPGGGGRSHLHYSQQSKLPEVRNGISNNCKSQPIHPRLPGSRPVSRLNLDMGAKESSRSLSSHPNDVENILKEMTAGIMTPLTEIASTPRKEIESKFNFDLAASYQIPERQERKATLQQPIIPPPTFGSALCSPPKPESPPPQPLSPPPATPCPAQSPHLSSKPTSGLQKNGVPPRPKTSSHQVQPQHQPLPPIITLAPFSQANIPSFSEDDLAHDFSLSEDSDDDSKVQQQQHQQQQQQQQQQQLYHHQQQQHHIQQQQQKQLQQQQLQQQQLQQQQLPHQQLQQNIMLQSPLAKDSDDSLQRRRSPSPVDKGMLSPAVSVVPDPVRPMSVSPAASSTSDDSGSESSESDSSNSIPPPPQEPPAEQEKSWALQRFLPPADSDRRNLTDPLSKVKDSDEGDLDIVRDVKTQPLLSSFSDSDTEKRPEHLDTGRTRRKRRTTRLGPDSDDSDREQPEIIEINSSPDPEQVLPEPVAEPAPAKLPRTPPGTELEPKVHLKRKCKSRTASTSYSPVKPKKKSRSVDKESPSRRKSRKRVVKPVVAPSDSEDEGGKRKRIICTSDSGDETWGAKAPPSRTRNLRRPVKGSSSDRPRIDSSSDDETPPVAQSPIKPVSRVAQPGKRPPIGSSESDAEKEESPPKLDSEGQSIQDKKKNDTLRKLFSKRDNEGGLGKGGKGKGGKGGKGKGKVSVVSESDSTPHHSLKLQSPKLQSPKLQSPKLLSPKVEPPRVPSPYPTQDEKIPEPVKNADKPIIPLPKLVFIDSKPSLTCSIYLGRLSHIPSKKRSEEVRTHTEIPDTRQTNEKGKKTPKDGRSDKRDRKHQDKHRTRDEKSKKKKSEPTEVKEETVEQGPMQPEVLKRLTPDVSQDPTPFVSSKSSVKRERKNSGSSPSSHASTLRQPNKSGSKRKKHGERPSAESESSLVDAPPTNHEREKESDHDTKSLECSEKQNDRPKDVSRHQYFSYFEHAEDCDLSDNDDKDTYLSEAKRLQHAADKETNDSVQGVTYLDAIMYFVLTGIAMEHESVTEKVVHTMYSYTLNLLTCISSKFRSQQNSMSPQLVIHNKLAVLSLRCQSILNLKLFKMRKPEMKECLRVTNEYMQKQIECVYQTNSTAAVEQCGSVVQGQGTPSPCSPTPSPASSVGSVGSSGYSSGELRGGQPPQGQPHPPVAPCGPCIAVPLAIHKSLQNQTANFNSLFQAHDLWDQADALVYKGKHREFFIELDRTCGPLTLHSSLKDLVKYVREGVSRLKGQISNSV